MPRQVMSIQTSKEWVLPPRPKPGRKPSVDTPASKRKAQNRAAQRALEREEQPEYKNWNKTNGSGKGKGHKGNGISQHYK